MNQSISEQIKKEAEARYGDPNAHSINNSMTNAFIAGASFRESLAGMRWVKASERLPEKFKEVIVRNIATGKVWNDKNMGHYHGWGVAIGTEVLYDRTEWLDESPMKSEGAEEGGWVRVEDGLPEVSGEYLVYDNTLVFPIQPKWFDAGYKFSNNVTHWMPLPPAPLT